MFTQDVMTGTAKITCPEENNYTYLVAVPNAFEQPQASRSCHYVASQQSSSEGTAGQLFFLEIIWYGLTKYLQTCPFKYSLHSSCHTQRYCILLRSFVKDSVQSHIFYTLQDGEITIIHIIMLSTDRQHMRSKLYMQFCLHKFMKYYEIFTGFQGIPLNFHQRLQLPCLP